MSAPGYAWVLPVSHFYVAGSRMSSGGTHALNSQPKPTLRGFARNRPELKAGRKQNRKSIPGANYREQVPLARQPATRLASELDQFGI